MRAPSTSTRAPAGPSAPERGLPWLRNVAWTNGLYAFTGACALLAVGTLAVDRRGRLGLRVVRELWAPWVLRGVGCRLGVTGELEGLAERPHVLVANHQGYLDIAVCYAGLPMELKMVAKKELFSVPLLGRFLKAFGYPPINRGQRDEAFRAFDQAAEMIKAGTSVLVFAEGTRTHDGQLGPFKKGAFILAIKAGVPILPVAISGSFEAFNRRDRWIRPGPIQVHVGAPIETAGRSLDDRHALLEETRSAIIKGLERATIDRTRAPLARA